jgi:hypothetical protein
MGRVIPAGLLLVAAVFLSGNACAMNSPSGPHCRVTNGDKLPAGSGGPDALCAAIERAVSIRLPGVDFSAEVTVLSSSMLAATLTANGRQLPEQKFASMDRDLDRGSFERFAQALADQFAKTHR